MLNSENGHKPWALITGASAGIGAAFAQQLAARGYRLILVARRQPQLEALAQALKREHGAESLVIPMDLSQPGSCNALANSIEERGLAIEMLVNNAGYGVPGAFTKQDWQIHRAFLQVMVETPLELCYRLLPGMQARHKGFIINVASLAGHLPGTAGHTLYAAAKSFLIKFTQSIALENKSSGIHATALCPGFTYSEFHDITGTRAQVSKMPRWMWQDAATVASQGIAAVCGGEIVQVTGRVNRTIASFAKIVPERWLLWLTDRHSRKFR